MQSPKFPLKVKDLRPVVESGLLKVIWKNKVREAMRRQPVPDPVEKLDFHVSLSTVCAALEAEVCNGSYTPKPPTRFLTEKSKGLCRQLVIPSVRDALVLQALSDDIWKELRKQAPTGNAFYAPNDQKFANGIGGHIAEYDSLEAWLKFQKAIFGFAETKKYIVVTDIANYYDFIPYEHLRNILADKASVREHALDLLLFALSSMLWQPDYMPRVPVGLPQIALDAPRLLAHCFLFEIDALMVNQKKVEYVRYMDDIDIGVDSLSEAKESLRDLDLALQTRQVRLNSGKTRILTAQEASSYFKIIENESLDNLSDMIDIKSALGISLSQERQQLSNLFSRWKGDGTFEHGNGQKILKRLINLSKKASFAVTATRIRWILAEFPGLRETALQWWREGKKPHAQIHVLREFVSNGHLVDDAFVINICTSIVSARLPFSNRTKAIVREIAGHIDPRSPWGFYGRIWLLSKYAAPKEVFRVIENYTYTWGTSPQLGRLVAGVYPLLKCAGINPKKLEGLLARSGQSAGREVLEFHESLVSGTKGYKSIEGFLKAINPSLPNKATHSKFLMLMSIMQNPDLNDGIKSQLKLKHNTLLMDGFYRRLLKQAEAP